MCAGHAQELKTQAIALQTGKRLRVFFSVQQRRHRRRADRRRRAQQVRRLPVAGSVDVVRMERLLPLPDGHDYRPDPRRAEDDGGLGPGDRRPMIVFGKTTKGYWPAAVDGKIPGAGDQIVGYPSHPFGFKMNSRLHRLARADLRAERYGVQFEGIAKGPVTGPAATAASVQDEHRRRDVRARSQRPRRLARRIGSSRSATRSRTSFRSASMRPETRSSTIVFASPICPDAADGDGQAPDGRRRQGGEDRAVPQGRARRRAHGGPSPKSSSG